MQKIGSKISRTLIAAVALLLILLFYGLSVRSFHRMPWHQEIIVGSLSPFQKSFHFIGSELGGVWNNYINLIGKSKENALLKDELAINKFKIERLKEVEAENGRLRELLSFSKKHELEVTGAEVVANDPRGDFRVISVNKGKRDGIEINMPVVSGAGLIGRVADVAANSSRVLLLTDPNSAVDVLVDRSRARAVLVGSIADTKLNRNRFTSRLEYLRRKSDVQEGDVIVTSGFDGIYPPGLPVGKIIDLEKDTYGVFREAGVISFADFSNIEEVLIVKRQQ